MSDPHNSGQNQGLDELVRRIKAISDPEVDPRLRQGNAPPAAVQVPRNSPHPVQPVTHQNGFSQNGLANNPADGSLPANPNLRSQSPNGQSQDRPLQNGSGQQVTGQQVASQDVTVRYGREEAVYGRQQSVRPESPYPAYEDVRVGPLPAPPFVSPTQNPQTNPPSQASPKYAQPSAPRYPSATNSEPDQSPSRQPQSQSANVNPSPNQSGSNQAGYPQPSANRPIAHQPYQQNQTQPEFKPTYPPDTFSGQVSQGYQTQYPIYPSTPTAPAVNLAPGTQAPVNQSHLSQSPFGQAQFSSASSAQANPQQTIVEANPANFRTDTEAYPPYSDALHSNGDAGATSYAPSSQYGNQYGNQAQYSSGFEPYHPHDPHINAQRDTATENATQQSPFSPESGPRNESHNRSAYGNANPNAGPASDSSAADPNGPKSGLQRAVNAVRSALPLVQRLLPLLDGSFTSAIDALVAATPQSANPSPGTGIGPVAHHAPVPQQVRVDLEPIERGLAEVKTGQRELRTQVLEQVITFKRVEDQLERVREATDRNTLEQQELVEDLRSVGSRVNIFAVVGLIVLAIILGANVFLLVQLQHILR